jgi:hypothetical protein
MTARRVALARCARPLLPQPPTCQVLASRQQQRLKEADSTLAKRLAWCRAQCARPAGEAPAAFDHVVPNGDAAGAVYAGLKEAISCLSPVIRNRLHGLPAYVLDYSDLIAPNRCAAARPHCCALPAPPWTRSSNQGRALRCLA